MSCWFGSVCVKANKKTTKIFGSVWVIGLPKLVNTRNLTFLFYFKNDCP